MKIDINEKLVKPKEMPVLVKNLIYFEQYLFENSNKIINNWKLFKKDLKIKINISIFDKFSFKDFATSQLISQSQKESKIHIEKIANIMKNDPNFFNNLKTDNILVPDFVFIILLKLFENINQEAIYSKSYIKKLLYHYSNRMTIGNLNNNIIKLIIKTKIEEIDLVNGKKLDSLAKDLILEINYFKVIFVGCTKIFWIRTTKLLKFCSFIVKQILRKQYLLRK